MPVSLYYTSTKQEEAVNAEYHQELSNGVYAWIAESEESNIMVVEKHWDAMADFAAMTNNKQLTIDCRKMADLIFEAKFI